ncbi:hypothetical protein [Actinomadura sp. 9N407]|uniref:hypothetical protein n=1 Tax=Actinomadura sp. 9N407 TaxID=3375154 RepID=UPI00379BD58B
MESPREHKATTSALAGVGVRSADARHRDPVAGPAEKLIRDRIPEIIRTAGKEPATRIADPSEYPALLRSKLYEEAAEYVASGDPSELADILEVVHALAALHDLAPEDLEGLRAAKETARGAFTQRLVLTLAPPAHPHPH